MDNTTETLPTQIVIKFSKWKLVRFIAMIFLFSGGVMLLIKADNIIKYIMAIFTIAISALTLYAEYPMILILQKPHLIIGKTGIETPDGENYPWKDIVNEKITAIGNAKPTYYFYFEAKDVRRTVKLQDLNLSPGQIIEWVKKYKQAFYNA